VLSVISVAKKAFKVKLRRKERKETIENFLPRGHETELLHASRRGARGSGFLGSVYPEFRLSV